jgi:para-nitrobenzyl esterase
MIRRAALLVLACGAAWAQTIDDSKPAPVQVEGGLVQGLAADGLTVYKGLPFAAPPVGDLRWRAPQTAAGWTGVRNADRHAPGCLPSMGDPPPSGASEDCLYLNVWTPAKKAGDRLPVLVWIYGGGFNGGSTSAPVHDGAKLARRGVVLVSIAYRVGVMGFFAHPELSAESPRHVSGNYGLLDMIAALRWIQRNGAAFGGDPKRVTIFGESAGGIAVSMLCASPLAKGLFQGAISQSGGSFGPSRKSPVPGENMRLLADAEAAGAEMAKAVGAPSVGELRALPAVKVIEAGRRQRGMAWPIVDGWVIPGDQYRLYEAGRFNDTPILVGYNSDEGLGFTRARTSEEHIAGVRARYGPFADRLLEAYPTAADRIPKTVRDLARDSAFGWHTWSWARLQSSRGKGRAFLYYFDQHPERAPGSPEADYGAPHGVDVPYVFENLETMNRPATDGDRRISDAMAAYWTNFAKHFDPNGKGLPAWPAFTDRHPVVMYFAGTAHTGPVPSERSLRVLDRYFAWRRSPEGAASAVTTTPDGIRGKRPVFGGACRLCPWGAMAEVVQAAMRPYGYDVQICYNCNAADAPRIVSEARMPPPYRPDPAMPEILAPRNAPGLGPVDFGAVAIQFLRDAYRGRGFYANEKPRTNLRLIANIQDPSYVLVAARAETGITDLSQVRQKRWPVRILTAGIGRDASRILAYYGLSKEAVEAAGGHVGRTPEDLETFDVAIGGGGGMTTAPEWSVWAEISQKHDLSFLELPDDLLTDLAREGEQERGAIPAGLYRGILRPIPTVVRTGTVVYGRDDMPDGFAYDVAKALDEQQQLLQWRHLSFSYNVHTVWNGHEVPLHPGAARYYREKGYMK